MTEKYNIKVLLVKGNMAHSRVTRFDGQPIDVEDLKKEAGGENVAVEIAWVSDDKKSVFIKQYFGTGG